jgi:hypothetical protein
MLHSQLSSTMQEQHGTQGKSASAGSVMTLVWRGTNRRLPLATSHQIMGNDLAMYRP